MDYNGRRLRHEQKYYISYGEYYNLVSKLSAVLKRDGNYGDKGYFIRSLYFDDMYNSSYYEKEAGNFTRSKYRIRIYNYSDKYGDIKLEQKCKIDRYIAKSSLVISKDQFYDIIDGGGEFLLDNRKKVAKDFYIATRYRLLRPSVIVDYYRDAFTMEEGQRCMQELLVRCPDLDGVVCVTDTVAFGAMRALREAGRHVGQDVGLAGVGDSWAGSMMEPGLATVRFYQKQVGQEAARILLQMLEEKEYGGPVRQVTLGYQVVERGSL